MKSDGWVRYLPFRRQSELWLLTAIPPFCAARSGNCITLKWLRHQAANFGREPRAVSLNKSAVDQPCCLA